MPLRSHQLRRKLIAALLVCALAVPAACRGGTAEDYEEKANLICSLARYTEWNSRRHVSPDTPFVIGIYGSDVLSENLREVVQDRRIKGRPVQIIHITAKEQARSCNILFVSNSEAGRLDSILDQVRREGVLTVGESKNFLKAGGVINFVSTPDGIRYEVDLEHAARERLELRGQLLAYALRPTTSGGSDPSRSGPLAKAPKPEAEHD